MMAVRLAAAAFPRETLSQASGVNYLVPRSPTPCKQALNRGLTYVFKKFNIPLGERQSLKEALAKSTGQKCCDTRKLVKRGKGRLVFNDKDRNHVNSAKTAAFTRETLSQASGVNYLYPEIVEEIFEYVFKKFNVKDGERQALKETLAKRIGQKCCDTRKVVNRVSCCQSPVPKIPLKIHLLKTDMLEYIVVCQLKKLCGLCQGTI
ncbi:unnamed protein product [Porites evermanni]|uniref:Uncharacterized protein n=1 Tax=Porites evermanni TaxID=104178 RepID=A0ABN8M3X0_9CNID|nr:unnamed protein product [Porites evermanni]